MLLGVTAATVGTWERGTIPRQRMRRKLARQLGVTEDELDFGPLPEESEAD
jgi:transcriptional regulator with XRE-family HTH domain